MTNTLKPFAYFACDPHTMKPVWSEDCVCQDDVYSEDETGTIGRPIVFVEDAEAYADARVREDVERLNFIEANPGWLRVSRLGHRTKQMWACVSPFTNYEYDLFKTAREMIGQGRTNEAIAKALGRSLQSVKTKSTMISRTSTTPAAPRRLVPEAWDLHSPRWLVRRYVTDCGTGARQFRAIGD